MSVDVAHKSWPAVEAETPEVENEIDYFELFFSVSYDFESHHGMRHR